MVQDQGHAATETAETKDAEVSVEKKSFFATLCSCLGGSKTAAPVVEEKPAAPAAEETVKEEEAPAAPAAVSAEADA